MNKPAFVVTDLDGYRDYSAYPAVAIKKCIEGVFTLIIVDDDGCIHIRDVPHVSTKDGCLNVFDWADNPQRISERLSLMPAHNRRPLSALLRLLGEPAPTETTNRPEFLSDCVCTHGYLFGECRYGCERKVDKER